MLVLHDRVQQLTLAIEIQALSVQQTPNTAASEQTLIFLDGFLIGFWSKAELESVLAKSEDQLKVQTFGWNMKVLMWKVLCASLAWVACGRMSEVMQLVFTPQPSRSTEYTVLGSSVQTVRT